MKLSEWLIHATSQLHKAGIDSPRLDALIMLGDALAKERAWILARPEHELSPEQLGVLNNLLTQRLTHKPMAYIRGKVEFYGRTFLVNEHVLVPRPESEAIIDLLLEIYPEFVQQKANLSDVDSAVKIADIGTGSGILGITAKLELPRSPEPLISLIDIDINALETAKSNVDLFTIDAELIENYLLANTSNDYDILLCNLPYVPDEYPINKAAEQEPALALFSGSDGLNHYRKLFLQLQESQNKPLYLLLEALLPQHADLQKIAAKNGYKLIKTNGLALLLLNDLIAPIGER